MKIQIGLLHFHDGQNSMNSVCPSRVTLGTENNRTKELTTWCKTEYMLIDIICLVNAIKEEREALGLILIQEPGAL